jgi:hypothetical protein
MASKISSFLIKPSLITEARTLTHSDSGKTYFLNAAGGFTITLPEPRGGINFRFIVKTNPTSNYAIVAKSNEKILFGKIFTSAVTSASDTMVEISGAPHLYFKANVSKVGDSLEILSDGTYWYCYGYTTAYDAMVVYDDSKSPSISPSVSVSISPSVSVSISPSAS